MSFASGDGVAFNGICLRGGTIVDGTGRLPYDGDLLIRNGRVAATGVMVPKVLSRAREIDVRGKIVAPCWVDVETALLATALVVGWKAWAPEVANGGVGTFVVCDGSDVRSALGAWASERAQLGKLALVGAVRQHTREPARACGLADRGTLEVGMKADVNVISLPTEASGVTNISAEQLSASELLRWIEGAGSYDMTIIGGVVTSEGGEPTDALPGQLVQPFFYAVEDDLQTEAVARRLRENLVVLEVGAKLRVEAAESEGNTAQSKPKGVTLVTVSRM